VIALKGHTKPGRSSLLVERHAVSKRLATLMADADGADRAGSEELQELRAEIDEALKRIGALDQALADAAPAALIEAEQATPRAQRGAARGRLVLAVLALNDLPESCEAAAKILRKQIAIELRRIERTRRLEFDGVGK
jgi:hypothetical protein